MCPSSCAHAASALPHPRANRRRLLGRREGRPRRRLQMEGTRDRPHRRRDRTGRTLGRGALPQGPRQPRHPRRARPPQRGLGRRRTAHAHTARGDALPIEQAPGRRAQAQRLAFTLHRRGGERRRLEPPQRLRRLPPLLRQGHRRPQGRPAQRRRPRRSSPYGSTRARARSSPTRSPSEPTQSASGTPRAA